MIVLRTLLVLTLVLYVVGFDLAKCPPGYRCRKPAANRLLRSFVPQVQEEVDIEMCEAGTFSPGGSDVCTPCERGTYASKAGAPGCYVCPKGHMCSQTNVEPTQCPIGTYNSLTRQTCCRLCQPGKFASFKGMSECDDCPSGHKCKAGTKLACDNES